MEELTINQIHSMMKAGELTAEKLVQQYLDRIHEIDLNGPKLNSVIELNPDALLIAKRLDKLFQETGMVGPLHGIPVLIKDNFDTLDNMETTAGSFVIQHHGGNPTEDAFVVKQIREAGAIILGKTNLSEMANFRGQRSVSGWSSRGGRTKNPYVLDRSPSGSSSGSGVAVAANLATVTIGTETDGSIISPAQTNGIVGIKPSIGLVSRSGIIPIAHTQDTAGPMTRTVKDAAILLETMVGYDPKDPVTEEIKTVDTDYTSNLDNATLQGKRIGVFRESFKFRPETEELLDRAISTMEDAGAEIIDELEMELPEDWGMQEMTVLLYEYRVGLNKYFKTRTDSDIHSIHDLIDLNNKNKERTLSYFGQEHVENAAKKGELTEEEYQEAMEKYKIFRENLSSLYDNNNLDTILAASGGPAWVVDMVNGDKPDGGSSHYAAVSGYCNITVPFGMIHGLPVGLSFIGKRFEEKKIIEIAHVYEQLTNHREPPTYIETIFG